MCRRQTHCPVTDTAVFSLGDTTQLTPHPSQKCASLKLESSAAGWNLQAWSGCRSRVQELQQAASPEPSVPAAAGCSCHKTQQPAALVLGWLGHYSLLCHDGGNSIIQSVPPRPHWASKEMQKAKSLTEVKITRCGLHASLIRMSCYKGQQYEKLAWKVQEPSQTWSGWLHEAP